MTTRTGIATSREWVKNLIRNCCTYHVLCTVDLTPVTTESCVEVSLQTYHMDYTGCPVKLTNIQDDPKKYKICMGID